MLGAMPDVSFRDFAGALMSNDDAKAANVLCTLLGVDLAAGQAGTIYFKTEMQKDQAFMMKAMGMRTVVENKDEGGAATLIGECFGFDETASAKAAKTLMAHYA